MHTRVVVVVETRLVATRVSKFEKWTMNVEVRNVNRRVGNGTKYSSLLNLELINIVFFSFPHYQTLRLLYSQQRLGWRPLPSHLDLSLAPPPQAFNQSEHRPPSTD
jgi:hypothetical protein